MDKKVLAHLEVLNQIKLTASQKDDVLAFFAKREADLLSLEAIDTSNTEPMVHILPTAVALREDAVEQLFAREELLAQAPHTDEGYFCVPRVIE